MIPTAVWLKALKQPTHRVGDIFFSKLICKQAITSNWKTAWKTAYTRNSFCNGAPSARSLLFFLFVSSNMAAFVIAFLSVVVSKSVEFVVWIHYKLLYSWINGKKILQSESLTLKWNCNQEHLEGKVLRTRMIGKSLFRITDGYKNRGFYWNQYCLMNGSRLNCLWEFENEVES